MNKFILALFIVFGITCIAQVDTPPDSLPLKMNGMQEKNATDTNSYKVHSGRQQNVNMQAMQPPGLQNDTVVEMRNKKTPVIYDSLFSVAAQQTTSGERIISERKRKQDIILPAVLLFVLIYFAWLRYQYPKELRENIIALFNINLAQQIYRDRQFSLNIFSNLLVFNFILVGGIYIYQLANYFLVSLPFKSEILNVGFCILSIPVIYIIKTFFYRILKLIFSFDAEINFFRFNTLIIYQLTGIVLLPFVILSLTGQPAFMHWVFSISLFVLGLALLLRILKGITVGAMRVRFHFLYFLIYLCGFEIAPLLILYKVFNSWVN